MTSKAYLQDISKRMKRLRVESSITQKELASITGLSLRSIQRFENGEDISLENFLKLSIAFELAESILSVIPDMDNRPSILLEKLRGKTKQRAHKMDHKASNSTKKAFKWGDEQ
ncbi:MAG: helix-turn-helix transcriptional regulator [Butyrivibrio sp.]|uniref:helix-turn-helix domain-containing protein n=1 Tax=Butyrivibrio sp. TaxID=28121 RepID=UPI001AFE842F|nr:helix-turn-helix transcriptional regulator [Butyrivibrio sp.]MBO6240210.1 helix-turn-helix transcriptional regulator [Butyrivibrio sp.]